MIICPWKEIRRYIGCVPGLEEAIEAIENLKSMEPATYPLANGCKFFIGEESTTRPAEGAQLEAHRNFLDVQYVFEGEEYMGWAPVDALSVAKEYVAEHDCSMHEGKCQYFHIPAGYCYIVFPEDAHAPMVHLDKPMTERKIIVKLKP